MKLLISFALFTLSFLSCSKDIEISVTNNQYNLLEGIWEYESQVTVDSDYVTIYRKIQILGDNSAIVIEGDAIFKSWDSGFCGTPPLCFYLTEGKYALIDDVINVDMNHYFFKNTKLQIIANNGERLTLKRLL